jgi:hypothetical protein
MRRAARACLAVGLSIPARAATLVFRDDLSTGPAGPAFSGTGSVVDALGYEGKGGADYSPCNARSGHPAAATTPGGPTAPSRIAIDLDFAVIGSRGPRDGSPSPPGAARLSPGAARSPPRSSPRH